MVGAINVLVLEDDVSHKTGLFDFLKHVTPEIEISFFLDFSQAIHAFQNQPFDLLIVDLLLEGSEFQGQDFIKKVREINNKIFIYVLTGIEYEGIPTENEFIKTYNIRQWIKKPILAKDLSQKILTDFELL